MRRQPQLPTDIQQGCQTTGYESRIRELCEEVLETVCKVRGGGGRRRGAGCCDCSQSRRWSTGRRSRLCATLGCSRSATPPPRRDPGNAALNGPGLSAIRTSSKNLLSLSLPPSLPPSLLVIFYRVVPEVSFDHRCQNIVQHICEEHYQVPVVPVVPITPAPIFPTTPLPSVPRSPRSHISPPPSKVKFPPALSAPVTPSERPSKRPSIRFKREPRPQVSLRPHHNRLLDLQTAVKSRPGVGHVAHHELPSPPGCRTILSQKCEKVPVKINRKLPEETCEEVPDIVCHLELETYEEPVCHNVQDGGKLTYLSQHCFAGRHRGV